MANNVYAFTLQTAQVTTGTPETVCNDSAAQNPLGCMMKWNGLIYRYVKFMNGTADVASVTAGVAHWNVLSPDATTPVYTVTSDETDALGAGKKNCVAGIFKGAVTDLYFTWIGVGGTHTVKCDTAAVAGDVAIGATTDLTFGRIAAGSTVTNVIFGVSTDSYSAGTGTFLLSNLIW